MLRGGRGACGASGSAVWGRHRLRRGGVQPGRMRRCKGAGSVAGGTLRRVPRKQGVPAPRSGSSDRVSPAVSVTPGREDAEGRRGGKKALKPGTGPRPHGHTATGVPSLPATPRLLPWPPRPRRAARRPKGQPARVSPAGIPGRGSHRARSARGQASKFPSRTSCWGCGPAGAVAVPGGLSCRGRGGEGGGGERQARGSCPGPRNLSHVGGTRLSREGTHTVYLQLNV